MSDPKEIKVVTVYWRETKLWLPDSFMTAVGGFGHHKEAHAAIGYLSTWAMGGGRFATVKVTGDGDGCLSAHYYEPLKPGQTEQTCGYELFALYDPNTKTYSFHS